MYIVAKIHNNELGRAFLVHDVEQGKNEVRAMAEEQFQRPLNDEELEDLENYCHVINLSDADNHYTFQVGIVEG